MKNFFDNFLDFISGGIFNVTGAAARSIFSKRKYSDLLEEETSNYIGMMIFAFLMIGLFAYIKFSMTQHG